MIYINNRELSNPYIDEENGMLNIVRKVLNSIPSMRIVYRQESVMEIAKLPLTTCSEQLIPVHAIGYYRIDKPMKRDSLMSLYSKRNESENDLNFTQFFYKTIASKQGGKSKTTIMHISGLNSRPVYPVTFDYARSILIFYKPWRKVNRTMFYNKAQAIDEFNEFLMSPKCPITVKQAYVRAKFRYESGRTYIDDHRKQEEYMNHMDDDAIEDVELKRYIKFSNSFHRPTKNYEILDGYKVDNGCNFDWKPTDYDQDGKDWLMNHINAYDDWNVAAMVDDGRTNKNNTSKLQIPRQHNGKEYSMDELVGNQRAVFTIVMKNLIDWINYTTRKAKQYKPLRMTVLGKGGTGKSYVINTIVAAVRKLFKINGSAVVVAPTGTAAFNVGAQTIQREFGIGKDTRKEMSKETKEQLTKTLKHAAVVIIDERSMIQSHVLSCAERNIRQTVYKGMNDEVDWAGIPVVIAMGDDYQLPPPHGNGIIDGFFDIYNINSDKKRSKTDNDWKGHSLFLNLTEIVIELNYSHRQKSSEKEFQKILNEVRVGKCSIETAQKLMMLHKSNFSDSEWKQIEKDATYLFANIAPMTQHNSKMLAKESSSTNPVANIKSKITKMGDSNKKPTWSHFDRNDVVKSTSFCVGAKVAIKGKNFYPKWGLHNGAIGTVKRLGFANGNNPNNNDLPEYVEVEFYDLNLPKPVATTCTKKVRHPSS